MHIFPSLSQREVTMNIYQTIAADVRHEAGFVPKPCWIARVLADYGRTRRIAYNRLDPGIRRHPCPPGKRTAIVHALQERSLI